MADRYRSLLCVLCLSGVFASSALACSGPGAGNAMMVATAIGYVSAIFVALILIPTIYLHARLSAGARWFGYVVLIALHPAWTISAYGGDCGMMRVECSHLFSVVSVLCFVIVCARTYASRGRPRVAVSKWALCCIILLAAIPAYVMTLPWTLNPTPWQVSAAGRRLAGLSDVQSAYFKAHGHFAQSEEELNAAGFPFRTKEDGFDKYVNGEHLTVNSPDFAVVFSGEIYICRIVVSPKDKEARWAVVGASASHDAYHRYQIYMMSDGHVFFRKDVAKSDSMPGRFALTEPYETIPEGWQDAGTYKKMDLESAGSWHER